VQFGDLAESDRESLILVLEGVLANVTTVTEHTSGFLRRRTTTSYHINWYEVPLKRLIVTKERYPHYEINIVTFQGQPVADQAAEYLNSISLAYDEIRAWHYNKFCGTLPFIRQLRAVYDSDPERLQGYGQYGVAVVAGHDW
jgi:hypothetical protein